MRTRTDYNREYQRKRRAANPERAREEKRRDSVRRRISLVLVAKRIVARFGDRDDDEVIGQSVVFQLTLREWKALAAEKGDGK